VGTLVFCEIDRSPRTTLPVLLARRATDPISCHHQAACDCCYGDGDAGNAIALPKRSVTSIAVTPTCRDE